ncbi:hypothetical protein [Hydrogenophaga sp. PBL-H3]|uniref:hypothetical protein n=1 Tax=Hydrogenophaga sp. PBL-H3 TaxID=434010 RepID=UPI00135B29A2|nr:hypothetical protein [Hydrogenophaga sp. PBL-H3]
MTSQSTEILSDQKAKMNKPEQHSGDFEEDGVDLIEIIIALAENALLLLLAPLFIGVLTYAVMHALPQRFESVSIVRVVPPVVSNLDGDQLSINPAEVPAVVAAYMTASPVLDAAMVKSGIVTEPSIATIERVRSELKSKIKTRVESDGQSITLVVSDKSPVMAQRLANVILESTFIESRPRPNERFRLEGELTQIKKRMQELSTTRQLVQSVIEQGSPGGELGKLVESYALISSQQSQIQRRILSIQVRLEGLTNETLLQNPTLPTAPVSPKKLMIAVLSTLLFGLLMLTLVLIRESWRKSYVSGQHGARITALKRKYGFGG